VIQQVKSPDLKTMKDEGYGAGLSEENRAGQPRLEILTSTQKQKESSQTQQIMIVFELVHA
jgi:hypothetical protein